MTTMFAQDARPRTSVVDQLRALGVKVHPSVEYGPGHRFDPCGTCGAVDAHANCTVYGADDDYRECCSWCVVTVANDFSARLVGRFDQVVVEIGVVAVPTPTVVLGTEDHTDLDSPTCARHWKAAVGVVAWSDGSDRERREVFCPKCCWDVQSEAMTTAAFLPPVVSALPVSDRELVAA